MTIFDNTFCAGKNLMIYLRLRTKTRSRNRHTISKNNSARCRLEIKRGAESFSCRYNYTGGEEDLQKNGQDLRSLSEGEINHFFINKFQKYF